MASRFTSLQIGTTIAALGTGFALGVNGAGFFETSVTTPYVNSTGGLLPVVASLSQTNFGGSGVTDGSGSGWSIQNPYSEPVLCKAVTLRVTTAANPTTRVDVSRGTGSLATTGVASGVTLFNNLELATGVKNSSGSLLYKTNGLTESGAILYPLNFVLDEAGGANDYLLFSAGTGTGKGLAADLHAECYSLD